MNYPFILAMNGDIIARVNFDGTWSVRWDRITDAAYAPPNVRQNGVKAFAKLLLAAKDNFRVVSWDHGSPIWTHYQSIIDYFDHDLVLGNWIITISHNSQLIARVNYDGSWSVHWDEIAEISRWTIFDYRATALIALCRLLMAAKDRFRTTPWEQPDDE